MAKAKENDRMCTYCGRILSGPHKGSRVKMPRNPAEHPERVPTSYYGTKISHGACDPPCKENFTAREIEAHYQAQLKGKAQATVAKDGPNAVDSDKDARRVRSELQAGWRQAVARHKKTGAASDLAQVRSYERRIKQLERGK